jgi:hypothetical protein
VAIYRQLRASACTEAQNLRSVLIQQSEVQVFVAGEIVIHTEDSRHFLHPLSDGCRNGEETTVPSLSSSCRIHLLYS